MTYRTQAEATEAARILNLLKGRNLYRAKPIAAGWIVTR